jgi:hypothetical protein
MSTPLEHLAALEKALALKGFVPLSPFFLDVLTRFYRSGKRTLVLRIGRRGGKSSTLSRIAVLEAIFGDHVVPKGDLGVYAIISVNRDEANSRLRNIKIILDALDVAYEPIEFGIKLLQKDVAFKVFSASIAGVSGFTAIGGICDEAAKWKDADSGANPAKEVIASLRPTMATMGSARLFISSSPLGTHDHHYELFERGDTDSQMVAFAQSWVANPTLTEQGTRELEQDERVWQREYAAIPQVGGIGAFDNDSIVAAIRPIPEGYRRGQRLLSIDASSGRNDAFTWCFASWCVPQQTRWLTTQKYARSTEDGEPIYYHEPVKDDAGNKVANEAYDPDARPILLIEHVDGLKGNFYKQVTGGNLIARLAVLCKQNGITHCVGDQREALMIQSEFQRNGIAYTSIPWTNQNKVAAVSALRRLFAEQRITLPDHAELRSELGMFVENITASGTITFGAKNRADDYVATILTALMADSAGYLSLSPTKASNAVVRWIPADMDI